MGALSLKFALDALKEIPEADRGAVELATWVAAALAMIPAAAAGWRVRHERPVERGHTSKVMSRYGWFAVLISAIFLGLSISIQVVCWRPGRGTWPGWFSASCRGCFPGGCGSGGAISLSSHQPGDRRLSADRPGARNSSRWCVGPRTRCNRRLISGRCLSPSAASMKLATAERTRPSCSSALAMERVLEASSWSESPT